MNSDHGGELVRMHIPTSQVNVLELLLDQVVPVLGLLNNFVINKKVHDLLLRRVELRNVPMFVRDAYYVSANFACSNLRPENSHRKFERSPWHLEARFDSSVLFPTPSASSC